MDDPSLAKKHSPTLDDVLRDECVTAFEDHSSNAKFEASLAAYVRQCQETAWREGFNAGEIDSMDPHIFTHTCIRNPYQMKEEETSS